MFYLLNPVSLIEIIYKFIMNFHRFLHGRELIKLDCSQHLFSPFLNSLKRFGLVLAVLSEVIKHFV